MIKLLTEAAVFTSVQLIVSTGNGHANNVKASVCPNKLTHHLPQTDARREPGNHTHTLGIHDLWGHLTDIMLSLDPNHGK